jgi:hypothetical protein
MTDKEKPKKQVSGTIAAMRERAKARRINRKKAKAEAAGKEVGAVYYGTPTPDASERRYHGLTRGQRIAQKQAAKEARAAFDYAKLVAKWERKLTREGWRQTAEGWVQGYEPPLSVEDAIVLRNKQKRQEKMGFDERTAAYLLSKGWQTSGVNNDVWSIQIGDNVCYRTLRRAYKVQLSIESRNQGP